MTRMIPVRTPNGVGRYLELAPVAVNGTPHLRLTVASTPTAAPVVALNLQPHEARKLAATLLAELSDAGLIDETEVPA